MALSAYALVTMAEAKAAVRLGAAFTSQEQAMLEAIVNGITQACETYARRPFKARAATEIYHGRGTGKLFLRRRPVVSVASLRTLDALGNTEQSFTASDYSVDLAAGIVYLRTYTFREGQSNVEATYTAGWASGPDDVKSAVLQWISRQYRDWRNDRAPVASESMQGMSTVYLNEDIPKFVKTVLDAYRLKGSVVTA